MSYVMVMGLLLEGEGGGKNKIMAGARASYFTAGDIKSWSPHELRFAE